MNIEVDHKKLLQEFIRKLKEVLRVLILVLLDTVMVPREDTSICRPTQFMRKCARVCEIRPRKEDDCTFIQVGRTYENKTILMMKMLMVNMLRNGSSFESLIPHFDTTNAHKS